MDLHFADTRTISVGFFASLLRTAAGLPAGALIIARGLNEQKRYETLMAVLDKSSRDVVLSRAPGDVFNAMASALRPLRL